MSQDAVEAARSLWEIEQIKRLKATYFRLVDTRDWEGVIALFTPDCELTSTVFDGVRRPREFFTRVAASITPGVSVHHGHMPELTLTSPTTAAGIWAMYDFVEIDGETPSYKGYGHYHETYTKDDEVGWRISSFHLCRLRLDRLPEPRVEDRLRILETERDILRTMSNYGHALDYGWEQVFADCWTVDAELYWPGWGHMIGIEQILSAYRSHTHAPETYHKHLLAEPLISLKEDEAEVQSMFVRLDAMNDRSPTIRAFGRYRDVLVRCADGRWRFRRRHAEIEASPGGRPASTRPASPGPE